MLFKREEFHYDKDEDVIGAGGFGVVFRSRLVARDETVALKVLNLPRQLNKRHVCVCKWSCSPCLSTMSVCLFVCLSVSGRFVGEGAWPKTYRSPLCLYKFATYRCL